jgi:catechol 2,3-dioxygenase-like lactoylglutathione lyase family enzyme
MSWAGRGSDLQKSNFSLADKRRGGYIAVDTTVARCLETHMIDHVSIGVRDVSAAKRFYTAALEPLGYRCLSESDSSLGYGREAISYWVNAATRPVQADKQSGLHFCFAAPTRESVRGFYAAALGAGGKDNGQPGLRKDYGPNYYAAFIVDPDGYRIEAYCSRSER